MPFGVYMQALTVFVARNILAAIIRNAHFCSWTQVPVLAVVEWVQGGVVVVVTDNILTSSKVQSLSLLQLKRMHFDAL